MSMTKFIIKDWDNRIIHLAGFMRTFKSYDDAEDALAITLGDSYVSARAKYQISEIEN